MRVVSGEFGGLNLKPVPGANTRPTAAKVKESIFNIINPYMSGGSCLDLFAGTGSLGIEAVSRGYNMSYLVDKDFKAINVIKENIVKTHVSDKFEVIAGKATDALKKLQTEEVKLDLVFLDPPYRMHITEEIVENMIADKLLNNGCLIVIETDYEVTKSDLDSLSVLQEKSYGETKILIYRYKE